MYLFVIDQHTMNIKDQIITYTFVQYEDELNGQGNFKITIPTSEESALYEINYNDYILFEEGIVGIVKGKTDDQTGGQEYNVTGTLSNNILSWRSLLTTQILKGKITTVAHNIIINNFINSSDKRKTDVIFLSDREEFYPTDDSVPVVNTQETGETVFDTINKLYLPYEYGFEAYPMITDLDIENEVDYNLSGFMFRTLKPKYRTVGNEYGLDPVVFSFELNNVTRLNHEEDGTGLATVAIVAGPGEGQDRKLIEITNPYSSYDGNRMELYVDARDIQYESTDDDGNTVVLTDEELTNEMVKRGMEKLLDCQIFHTFDGSVIVEGENSYRYKSDYYKGDFVTVVDKKNGVMYDVQVIGVTKSISNGVEHFDLTFGWDNVRIKAITDNFNDYKVINVTGGSSGDGSGGTTNIEIQEIKTAMGGFSFGYDSSGNAGYYEQNGKFTPWTVNYEAPYDVTPWILVESGEYGFVQSNNTWKAIYSSGNMAYSKLCITNPFDYDIKIDVIPFITNYNSINYYTYAIFNDKKIYKNVYKVSGDISVFEFDIIRDNLESENFYLILKPGVNELSIFFVGANSFSQICSYTLESLIAETAKKYLYKSFDWYVKENNVFSKIYDDCYVLYGDGEFENSFYVNSDEGCDYELYLGYVNYNNVSYSISLSLNDLVLHSSYNNNYFEIFNRALKVGENVLKISGKLYSSQSFVIVKLKPVIIELEDNNGE